MIGKDTDLVVKINIFKKYTFKEMEIKILGREGQGLERILKHNFIEMEKNNFLHISKYTSLQHIYISYVCAMHMAII